MKKKEEEEDIHISSNWKVSFAFSPKKIYATNIFSMLP